MEAIKLEYDFNKANEIVSKFIGKEDDYRSIDKLIPVWKEVSGVLWQMEGFIIESSFHHDYVSDFYISSNWQAQGLGGYPDSMQYDCSWFDDDNADLTIQERALITTAKIISYEINKDFETDLWTNYEYIGLTKDFLNNYKSIDYTTFKYLSKDKPEYLISLIKENQLPPHMMEHAISNLAKYNKNQDVFELIMEYTKSNFSVIRRGVYTGIYYFNKSREIIPLLKDLREKDRSRNNQIEIDRLIRSLERMKEESNEKL